MKICQINATYGFGSTGAVAKEINGLAKKSGFETISCAQKSNNKSTYIIGNKLDWKIHGLLTRVFGTQGYFSVIPTLRLIRYLKKEKPDIVHLHNLHSNYINIKLLFKHLAKYNIKTILTLHDCWFFTGKCFHFVDSNCDKWKTCCNKCPQKHHSVNSWFFDRSKKVFNDRKKMYDSIKNLTVVGCSEWITSLAKQSPLFEKANIISIKNGVDTSIFNLKDENYRAKLNLENRFVILCFANKLLDRRNQEVKERLIANLKEDERMIVAGCNKEQIDELKGNEKVICYKYVDNQQEMSMLFSSVDVFVNLTLADTLPTVNMESICCGTPVITYNSCGSPELIQEGVTGYIVDQSDYKKLIVRTNEIRNRFIHKSECSRIGAEQFNKFKQYKEYIELYNKISR